MIDASSDVSYVNTLIFMGISVGFFLSFVMLAVYGVFQLFKRLVTNF